MKIVGVDLSLTSTGIATINDGTVKTQTITSTGKADATLEARHVRLHNLRLEIALAIYTPPDYKVDLVVIEGPSYNSKNGRAHDRSGLWWILVDWLMNDGAEGWGTQVVEVPPGSRMKYATGKGVVAKDRVLAAVIRRYPNVPVDGNDQADALILAAMGARRLGHPVESSLPQTHLAAMDGVHWPDITEVL